MVVVGVGGRGRGAAACSGGVLGWWMGRSGLVEGGSSALLCRPMPLQWVAPPAYPEQTLSASVRACLMTALSELA